ncbi:transposase domain-containing protein [Nostoc sp.]|uniref:transposase domain-containing protein n=1 Tax=Nostoc sp. TaxID=1180 RepID=UPI002FF7BCB8
MSDAIEQAIAKTNSQQERQRKLPSHLVISLVIAMSLWSSCCPDDFSGESRRENI